MSNLYKYMKNNAENLIKQTFHLIILIYIGFYFCQVFILPIMNYSFSFGHKGTYWLKHPLAPIIGKTV